VFKKKTLRKKKRSLGIGLIAGVIVMTIGVGLTAAAGGHIVFIGAIVTGIVLIVRGIISYTRA
jgi:hypothetical protein